MPITTKSSDSPAERYYTDAPEAYDWGWTRTLAMNVATTERGRTVRLVEISDGYHADFQVGRYQSGSYLALTPAEFEQWVKAGYLTPTPETAFRT